MFTNGSAIGKMLEGLELHLEQDGIDSFKVLDGESRKELGRIWAREDGLIGFSAATTDIPSALSTLRAIDKHK